VNHSLVQNAVPGTNLATPAVCRKQLYSYPFIKMCYGMCLAPDRHPGLPHSTMNHIIFGDIQPSTPATSDSYSSSQYHFVGMTSVTDFSYSPSEEEKTRNAAQIAATGRRNWKTLRGKGEAVWPPHLYVESDLFVEERTDIRLVALLS
jgi:hypothetical protein